MIRVGEGHAMEFTLANRIGNVAALNIDPHAVTGPEGSAVLTDVSPGESTAR